MDDEIVLVTTDVSAPGQERVQDDEDPNTADDESKKGVTLLKFGSLRHAPPEQNPRRDEQQRRAKPTLGDGLISQQAKSWRFCVFHSNLPRCLIISALGLQRTLITRGLARVANLPAVRDEVEMECPVQFRRDERFEQDVRLFP